MMHTTLNQMPVATPPSAAERGLDLALAAVIGILSTPLYGLLLRAGTLTHTPQTGLGGHVFQRLGWHPNRSLAGRIAWRLGAGKWLALVHVLKGDLAWAGPRALQPSEPLPPQPLAVIRAATRPGVCSLWQLRQLTSIDYGTEWEADAEQLRQVGFRTRWGLVARCLVAMFYGARGQGHETDSVWVDTVRVHSLSMDEAIDRIDGHVTGSPAGALQVAFANPDCINIARRNADYRRTLNQAGLVLPDGIGMRIAGKLLQKPFRQNVNGTDLFPRLCARLGQRGGSVYLLGARPGVAQAVAEWVARHHPDVRVVGAEHGYFTAEELPAVLARVRATQPDLLLVAMGAPTQERWIAQHAEASGARVAMGVGGLFDFYSGRMVRAPQWVREMGLEWAFRLLQEPGRLWRRYLVGNVSFLMAVALQRLLGSASDWHFEQTPAVPSRGDSRARRAVVWAVADRTHEVWRDAGVQPATLPLGDRPLVMRTIETLAAMGCREVDVLADHGLDVLTEQLGDGTRWGVHIRLHRVAHHRQGLARLKALAWQGDETVMLVRADHWLPRQSLAARSEEVLWAHVRDDSTHWAGWACVRSGRLASVAASLMSAPSLEHPVLADISVAWVPMPYVFDAPAAVLQAQARWMTVAVHDTLPERSPGVRVAPSAHIAPDATVVGPVEILSGAVVASGAVVGPYAHVGAGVVIEPSATVCHAMLAAGTYVANGAEVDNALVLATGVVSARWAQWLPARLTLAAAGPLALPQGSVVGIAERSLALGLLILAAGPALLAWAMGSQSRLVRHLVPGLPNVIRGRVSLIGRGDFPVWPASVVDAGWVDTCQQASRGLVTPAMALGASIDTPEARAWADIHWLVNPCWAQRWQLLGAYARHLGRPAAG